MAKEHYTLEFIFSKSYSDNEYLIEFTDGFCDIFCKVNGQEPIPMDINDLASDQSRPYYAKGQDWTHEHDNYHVTFVLNVEDFDLRNAKFYTYGQLGRDAYINIDVLCYGDTDYEPEERWYED